MSPSGGWPSGAAEPNPEFPRCEADLRDRLVLRVLVRVCVAQLLAGEGRADNGRDSREAAPAHGSLHAVDLTIDETSSIRCLMMYDASFKKFTRKNHCSFSKFSWVFLAFSTKSSCYHQYRKLWNDAKFQPSFEKFWWLLQPHVFLWGFGALGSFSSLSGLPLQHVACAKKKNNTVCCKIHRYSMLFRIIAIV